MFSYPNFISHKQRGLLESFTPSTIAKESVSNKVVHTPPIGIGIREASASSKATNIPGTKEDLILLGKFQKYTNKIVKEDTSHDKDFDASIKIIKLPSILVEEFLVT